MDMTAFLEGTELLMHVAHGAPRRSDLMGMRRKMERDARLKSRLNGHSRKRQRQRVETRSTSRSKKIARRDGSLRQHGSVSKDSALRVANSRNGERRLTPKHILSNAGSKSHVKKEQPRPQAAPKAVPKKKIQKLKPVPKKVGSPLKMIKTKCKPLNISAKAESSKNKVQSKSKSTPRSKLKPSSHLKSKACKGLHKLKKYKGYYRCRLCSKTLPQVFLCCNCDWAGCEGCIESKMKRKKSNIVGQTKKKSIITSEKKKQSKNKMQSSKVKASKFRGARDKDTAENRGAKPSKLLKVKTTIDLKIAKRGYKDAIKRKVKLEDKFSNPKATTPSKQTLANPHVNNSNTPSHPKIFHGFTKIVPVRSMTSEELCARLRRSGKEVLAKVAAIIEEEELDGEDVVDLTRRELSLILPKLGMRKKLQKFLADLAETSGESHGNGGKILIASKEPWIVPVTKRSPRSVGTMASTDVSNGISCNAVLNKRRPGGASVLKHER